MSHVSPWFDHVLKEHISGTRPTSALVQRIAEQYIYGTKKAVAADTAKPIDKDSNE